MSELYKSPIKLAGGEERFVCPQSLVLNTYLGCDHDCIYCYARDILEPVKKWSPVKPADISIIEKTMKKAYSGNSQDMVSKLIRRRTPFRFANISDGFLMQELKYKVSYNTLLIMGDYQHPLIINTKGIVVALDNYIKLLRHMPVVVQMTITTENQEKANLLEPNAPDVESRIGAVKKLSDAGITCQVRYSPVYPKLTDNPEKLFELVSKAGAKDIICEMGRIPVLSKQKAQLNKGLGYDYLAHLRALDYPMFKFKQQWRVEQPFIFTEYERFKKIAESYGLNFFVCCEEKPEINDWCNCCGTHQYKGFEQGIDWTIQMNGHRIRDDWTSFDEYIKDFDIPYEDGFRKFWDAGKYELNLYGMEFNKHTKCYRRCKPFKERKLFS